MAYIITDRDLDLKKRILKYTSPENIPIKFRLGEEIICGIPQDYEPQEFLVETDEFTSLVVTGENNGIEIKAEYREYNNYPVTEWTGYISYNGKDKSPIVDNFSVGGRLGIADASLCHGNGDTCGEDGYSFETTKLTAEKLVLTPFSGTSCQGAFPYMTISSDATEIRAAVGWPTKWRAEISETDGYVEYFCSQDRCHTYLKKGETIRTPRLTLMAYEKGDSFRGINLWRHWYFDYVLPKSGDKDIGPMLCLHNFMAEGHPEFTGATEENQINALREYIRRGMKPDVWWIDAGWYKCDYDWTRTGSWTPDTERFPNGLGPIGEECDKNGVKLLLWFEPERVRGGEALDREHPEWVLKLDGSDGLLNLGNPDALEWLCRHVDGIIKDSRVKVYRQDFNFNPLPIWMKYEDTDRIGILENQHGQGYLKYWDYLLDNNPGLIIDSCASGGRRNDLETMRRAITLHYTDVGYGNHPIKQKQHREMFEWIPYFRAHNMNWANPETGEYDGSYPTDEFSFMNAMTPSLTSMITYDADEKQYEMGKKYDKIWRKAAELELRGDYYPMTECRADSADWYAMQFADDSNGDGFVQAVRNTKCKDESHKLTLPHIAKGNYTFTDLVSGESWRTDSKKLETGVEVIVPEHTSVIWYYKIES